LLIQANKTPITQSAGAMSDTRTVWVLQVSHRHGEDLSCHSTEQRAKAALAEYCEEWWEHEVQDKPMPEDPQERIKLYYEEVGEESADISAHDVEFDQ
jgi:hypothetical protein